MNRLLPFWLICLVLFLTQCKRSSVTPSQTPTRDNNLALGNLSGATTQENNYLIERATYTLSYNRSTFILTNIVPQAPTLNRQAWNQLEAYTRTLITQGNEAYVINGTYGRGGTGDNGKTNAIADGKITVPAALWKVIVVLPVGSDDLSRISAQTRVIAIWAPNSCRGRAFG